MTESKGLYIQLISVHGLVRGENMELGRDADTGGQIKYVVELARALGDLPEVERVDLLTRKVEDSKVDSIYAQPEERIGQNAFIVRLPCGPRRYLRKEVLWPYLDSFADQALKHIRRIGKVPDMVHSHYADAGYVGARLAALLEVPLIHTGHSLGRDKLRRLLDQGMKQEVIESEYRINMRIEAEEVALDNAAFVIASTRQEVEQQYSHYDNYQPKSMVVIPPGVDLKRFYPPKPGRFNPGIWHEVNRFLDDPKKPLILAMSRPDRRKNVPALIKAYGENEELQQLANLVLILGNRDDIQKFDKGSREVLNEVLYLIDLYDLYGKVSYPKHHHASDVPFLYRIAAKTKGVFINPALTEPFGLTLIEAAASGVPLVATEDGGPKDIVAACKNGILIDPLDTEAMAKALLETLQDKSEWRRKSRSGISGANRHFSWQSHAQTYMQEVKKVLKKTSGKRSIALQRSSRLPISNRALICDVDNTLIGDGKSLLTLLNKLNASRKHIGFGIATGRYLESTLKTLKEWDVPLPDFFITSVGTEIYYNASRLINDTSWARHIDHQWQPDIVKKVMQGLPGIKLQPKDEQRPFKISYFYNPKKAPTIREVRRLLRQNNLHVNVVFSHHAYLDVLPVRASKGLAVRYLASKWGYQPDQILVAGDAGSDEDMLSGDTLGVVVANHSRELNKLKGRERIYFADKPCAGGILDGMEYYDFFGAMKSPDERG